MEIIQKITLNYLESHSEYNERELFDENLKELIKKEILKSTAKRLHENTEDEILRYFKNLVLNICYQNKIIIKVIKEKEYKSKFKNPVILKGVLLDLVIYLIKNYQINWVDGVDEVSIERSELDKLFIIFKIPEDKKEKLLSYSNSENEKKTYTAIFEDVHYFRINDFYAKIKEKVYREITLNQTLELYEAIDKYEKISDELKNKFEITENKLEKSEIGLISTMGILVSLFTLISINVNFFKEATTDRTLLEIALLFFSLNLFTIISIGSLIWMIKYFFEGNNTSDFSLKKLSCWWIFIAITIIIIFFLVWWDYSVIVKSLSFCTYFGGNRN